MAIADGFDPLQSREPLKTGPPCIYTLARVAAIAIVDVATDAVVVVVEKKAAARNRSRRQRGLRNLVTRLL